MEHGRSYGLCKKILAAGKSNKDSLLDKFDILLMSDGLTEDDYKELVDELNALNA